MLKRTRSLKQQRQIMERIQNVLLARIAARVRGNQLVQVGANKSMLY
jgi:hypothetical protein